MNVQKMQSTTLCWGFQQFHMDVCERGGGGETDPE